MELIRVSRQMRKLRNSKRFGAIYNNESSNAGSLTIFCPSCPQPGINLPPDWTNLPDWVTRRTITVDGNFHADHIKMRRPDLDIALSDGQGFMVESSRFMEYLNEVKEPSFVGVLLIFACRVKLTFGLRGRHVETTEQSMQLAPTIGGTWM